MTEIKQIIFSLTIGLIFIYSWGITIYKWIYYWTFFWPILYDGVMSWEVGIARTIIIFAIVLMITVFSIIMIKYWVIATISWLKLIHTLLKKHKIKENKRLTKKIDAKVTAFHSTSIEPEIEYTDLTDNYNNEIFYKHNINKNTSSYYFTASDWINTYDSEQFYADVIWWCWDLDGFLKSMKISYNPENLKNTIKALNERSDAIEMEILQHNWPKSIFLKMTYDAIQKVKRRLKCWINPYMEFKWHKLSIGDKVNVYLDPENPKNYWIDTKFLYT